MEWKATAGAKPAATVAALFDKGPEKVGYVFWGFLAMGVIKKEMEYCELECVINDKHLQRAVHLLEGSGHPSCTKNTCSELKEVRELSRDDPIHLSSTHPVGDAHFHLEDGFILHLFRQSTMLPWMDPIPEGPVETDDPDLILTTDPSLPRAREDGPSGRWIGLEPVKILNANCFTESIIWLMCRDLESNDGLMDRWHGMSILMHDTTRSTRRLRPEYQRVWDCLQYRGDYSDMRLHMFHELILLRKRLIANGSLPGNLPKISVRDWSVNRTWYSRLWCDLWLRW